MKPLSKKLTFSIPLPTEDDPRSDCDRVLDALRPGFGELRVDLTVMRMLYPACRRENGQVTATMIWQGDAWHLTRLEAGDTTAFHYGLAADLGSTSVTMELVDLNRGEVVSKATRYNLQRAFGDDILTRIFYGKDQPDHIQELQEATAETYETGKLTYGNANPDSEDFNSLADFIFSGDYVEIRLPWQLFNFANPSEMMIHDDYYLHYGVEYIQIDEMYVGITDSAHKEYRINMESFPLKGWGKKVTYHERLKESYYIIRDYWTGGD